MMMMNSLSGHPRFAAVVLAAMLAAVRPPPVMVPRMAVPAASVLAAVVPPAVIVPRIVIEAAQPALGMVQEMSFRLKVEAST